MKSPGDNVKFNGQGNFDSDYARKVCEKLAGPFFDEMMGSYELTMDHLRHSDPRARLGALFLLRDFWKSAPDFAQICEKFAFGDNDFQVRGGALSSLCGCYYGTRDARMGRLFSGIVRDEAQPLLHRRIAYTALFSLRALLDRPHADTIQFPDEVDWGFVDSFQKTANEENTKSEVPGH